MKYNIVTTLNNDYMPFGILFINSLFDNIDLDSINKVYVFDTGLQENDIRYLELFPKVQVEKTPYNTEKVKMHMINAWTIRMQNGTIMSSSSSFS